MDLTLPEGPTTVHGLLSSIFAVADAIHARSAESCKAMGKPVTCGPGCDTCCSQLIPISEWEAAHIADVVRSMDGTSRSRIVNRFTWIIARLEQSGLLEPMTHIFSNEAHDWKKMLELKLAYWNLDLPCPFLENGSCSIYMSRPLACRQYLVTSAPRNCSNIYSEGAKLDVVAHPADTGGALASFSGHGLQHSRVLPHIFSLLAERGIKSRETLTLPAPQMMDRFLNCLAICFTRKD